MKQATQYGKKIKRALPSLRKRISAAAPPEDLNPLELFVVGVLREQSTLSAALSGLDLIRDEFVDFNELRVAPPKDIVDLLPEDMPDLRAKAGRITDGLNRIFDHENRLDFEHTGDMGKRELQAHLRETLGFSAFTEAYLLLHLFGHRAVPVDSRLVDRLKADGLVHADATDDDVRTVLERIIGAKDQAAAFEVLALYAQEPIKTSKKKKAKKKAAKKKKKTAKTKTSKKAATKTPAKKKTAKKTATKAAKKKAPKKKKAAKKATKKRK